MAISELIAANYRSIRKFRLKLKQINVLVGPNGCGKTNLYRSMFLLHAAANGQLARTIVLRYLCLLAALMSPRPPAVLALNEPETSIHPDLIEPLARLIVRASRDSQLWVTTHSEALAASIERQSGAAPIRLEKVDGETRVVGQRLIADEE